MVFTTGLIENLNHITRGVNDDSFGGLVLFLVGVALVVAAWLLATPLTLKFPRLVEHGGRLVTRWFGDFLEKERPVAKFQEKDISPYFWPQGKEPVSEEYRAHLAQQFQNYKLKVGGLVENQSSSLTLNFSRCPNLSRLRSTTASKAGQVSPSGVVSLSQRL